MKTLTKAFRQALYENKRDYLITADITLTNNTKLSLTNSRLWSGGLSLDDAVSDDSTFGALGSTIINTASLIINNEDEAYSSYDFKGAAVVISVGMKLKSGSSTRTETIKKGTYTVDEATFTGSLINLYCLDKMEYFDRPYKTTNLSYPATLDGIVRDACTKCGITLQTTTFPHQDYVVKERPNDDSTTFRDVIGWAAQIAGCFARMNADGKLELKWFDTDTLESRKEDIDGGTFNPWNTGAALDGGTFNPWSDGTDADMGTFETEKAIHYINNVYTEDIAVDDTVITQVKILTKEETEDGSTVDRTFKCGSDGYTVEISDNDFITVETAQAVADWLGAQIIGLTFRKASVSHASTPAIEAGDIGLVWDRKGREYPILITRTRFSPTSTQTTMSASETPSRNNATRYSQRTKSYVDARKMITREKTHRELQLENLAEKLAAHSGLYSTAEKQSDGSYIYYLHDMPDKAESQIIWKMAKEAWGVSTDGGEHWNAGMTVDGDTIVRILTATGVDADWINTGSLLAEKNGKTLFSFDVDTGEVLISADHFKLIPAGSTSSTSAASYIQNSAETVTSEAISGLTQTEIFNKLTNNGATKGLYLEGASLYMNASFIKTGTLNADLITAGSMNAARITAGVLKSANGNFKIDLDSELITAKKFKLDSDNLTITESGTLTAKGAKIIGTIESQSNGSLYDSVRLTGGKIVGGSISGDDSTISFANGITLSTGSNDITLNGNDLILSTGILVSTSSGNKRGATSNSGHWFKSSDGTSVYMAFTKGILTTWNELDVS